MTNEQLAADYTKPETLTNEQLAAAISEEDLEIYIKFSYNNGADVWRNVLKEAARRVRGIRHQLGHGDFDETVRRAHVVCDMWEHYEHAREKHPYFCDKLLSSTLPPTYREEVLSGTRRMLLTEQSFNQLHALSLLECEEDELKLAISRNDISNAIEEAYDCIAVLLRIIDVLEGRQKLGRPEEGAAK